MPMSLGPAALCIAQHLKRRKERALLRPLRSTTRFCALLLPHPDLPQRNPSVVDDLHCARRAHPEGLKAGDPGFWMGPEGNTYGPGSPVGSRRRGAIESPLQTRCLGRTAGSHYLPYPAPRAPRAGGSRRTGEGRALINPRPEIPPEGPGTEPGNPPAPPSSEPAPSIMETGLPADPRAQRHILAFGAGRGAKAKSPPSGRSAGALRSAVPPSCFGTSSALPPPPDWTLFLRRVKAVRSLRTAEGLAEQELGPPPPGSSPDGAGRRWALGAPASPPPWRPDRGDLGGAGRCAAFDPSAAEPGRGLSVPSRGERAPSRASADVSGGSGRVSAAPRGHTAPTCDPQT
nr:basic salivary proline-rich protein 1-like [Desmodus rotundus]